MTIIRLQALDRREEGERLRQRRLIRDKVANILNFEACPPARLSFLPPFVGGVCACLCRCVRARARVCLRGGHCVDLSQLILLYSFRWTEQDKPSPEVQREEVERNRREELDAQVSTTPYSCS